MSKYPRTPHLPWSPGGTSDDKKIKSIDHFLNRIIIITEKMDGSNVCLESNNCFARSHSSQPNHPSFDAFKSLHSQIKHLIPNNLQIFGEWLFAKHSIYYDHLPSWLMIFGVRDLKNNTWGSWEEVILWAQELNVPTAPLLFEGVAPDSKDKLIKLINNFANDKSSLGESREGIVIRLASSFADIDFHKSVAKWVRKDHVQTDDHWKNRQIIKNKII